MSGPKVWDETWTFEFEDLFVGDTAIAEFWKIDGKQDTLAIREARARLAAQAPAMARLLLSIYEAGKYNRDNTPVHEIADILKAAGVLP